LLKLHAETCSLYFVLPLTAPLFRCQGFLHLEQVSPPSIADNYVRYKSALMETIPTRRLLFPAFSLLSYTWIGMFILGVHIYNPQAYLASLPYRIASLCGSTGLHLRFSRQFNLPKCHLNLQGAPLK